MRQGKMGNQWHFGVKVHPGDGMPPIEITWHVTVRPCDRQQRKARPNLDEILVVIKQLKACVRTTVVHPFRAIRQQFGHTKVHCRGLAENTAQLKTLFALSNLWIAQTDEPLPDCP